VSLLASIDEAQGLFRRAIIQSGSVAFTSSREDCQRLTQRVLDFTGAKTVAELQALSPEQIIALNNEVGEFFRFPERDGEVIPEDPYSRFDGFNSNIDMLIGSNADEVRYWVDAMGGEGKFDLATQLWCRYIIMSLDSAERSSAKSYYRYFRDQDQDMEGAQIAQSFLNDLMFRGPAIEMARRHAESGGKTYMYLWRQKLQTSPQETYYGACHGSEVCYVLNTGRQIKTNEVPDPALASEVQQMWVNFAATGNPSTPSHYWPAYESLQGATMILDKTSITVYNNDKLPGQLVYISPLLKEYISPIFSDLLDKAPWYAAVAIGTLVAFLLLLTWLIVKLRHRFKKNQSNKTNTSNE
jgi:para-nitrobenzyl esterase